MAFCAGLAGLLAQLAACGDEAGTADADVASPTDLAEVTPDVPAEVVPDVATGPADRDLLHARILNVLVNGRTTVIVAPGATLTVTFGYEVWSPPGCATCQAQVVMATSDGASSACGYEDVPGAYPGKRGDSEAVLVAPSTPGTYGVRWQVAQVDDCAAALAAYAAAPAGSDATLLEFLVQE